jgi:hypothetical protein
MNVGDEKTFGNAFAAENVVAAPEIVSSFAQPEVEKTAGDYLNEFSAAVAESVAGKILLSVWILGAIGFAFRDVFALWRLRKMRQSWREATVSEREELFVPENVSLYFGEESPATVGLFRPAIVLPPKFPDDLSLSQKRFIVRHELSHALWRDPLANFILRLVRSALWISPALWLLERIAVNEREAAADRAAVMNHSANESEFENAAFDYAATLVSVAKHFSFDRRREFPVGASGIGLYRGGVLENRVRRVLARPTRTTNFRIFLAAMIFAGSFAGLFFMPIAFRAEAIKVETRQAAVVENREPEVLSQSENATDLQSRNARREPPQLIRVVENRERKSESGVSNHNENKSGRASMPGTENYQIPRVISVERESPADLSDEPAAVDSADSMRKIAEADMERNGLNQKLDESSGKVQGLDEARKNLKSGNPQARQKAASEIDSLMRKIQTVNDSGRKSN